MGVEPKTLHRGEESWELVVEKLVRVGPNYYRPRRQYVRGREDILQALDRLNWPALAEDAKRAMDGPPQAYQVTDGRLEPFEGEQKPPSESHDETLRLARRCARLESRVEALEAALRTSRAPKRRSRPSSPLAEPPADSDVRHADVDTPKTRSASPARGAAPPPSSRPQQRERERDEDPREHQPADVRQEAAPSEAAPSEAAPSEASARLKFPERGAISAAYANLVGNEMLMTDIPAFTLDDGTFYMTDLLDESDAVVGALVLDLRATVFQAGALTMLDEDARQAMFESGEPSADTLDAMGELLGAQSRCFNSVPGNPHVHINTLRPPDAEKDAWVFSPAQSMGLRDPFEGRMLFVSR